LKNWKTGGKKVGCLTDLKQNKAMTTGKEAKERSWNGLITSLEWSSDGEHAERTVKSTQRGKEDEKKEKSCVRRRLQEKTVKGKKFRGQEKG